MYMLHLSHIAIGISEDMTLVNKVWLSDGQRFCYCPPFFFYKSYSYHYNGDLDQFLEF